MKRIFLFMLTNIAVLAVLGVVLRLFGVDEMLRQQGGQVNYTGLLIFSAVFGMVGSLVSLALSKRSAIMMTGARVIESPASAREAWLVSTVGRLADRAGIGMPDVAVYGSPQVNAFATGARRNSALVAVSTGLLETMSDDEVEGVLGHEVAHIANGDMVTMTLLQGVLNTFVIFLSRLVGYAVDRRSGGRGGHGPGFFLTYMLAQAVLGLLATIIVRWFSRYREFRADDGGAELAGRGKMVAALNRLNSLHAPGPLPDKLAAFGISGSFRQGLAQLFATHPPLAQRIAALSRLG